ncbi:MAG: metallophosphoesterase, partial [Myxococcales bacterium]|nr:metallophosphoesterase [Myxococcales bacterium]
PGDLVDNGLLYWQWADHFFGPAQALLRQVPTYPVLGNHEINAPAYFDYFHLPENGTAGFDEHWYYVDHSNLRVIGLDSNPLYRLPAQLDWLDGVLADACADDRLDFVFAQLHHPHHSELWPAGNAEFTGDVIERLEGFSTDCGKPSVHFYGHTHAYSRGQSRDHQHLMVNVASAGGNLDYWGEYAQIDYPEHTVSQDDYGFVLVEVAAGDDPRFRLRRYSQGQPDSPLDNVLRDDIQVRIVNQAPDVPGPWGPLGDRVNPGCFTVGITPYADPEDDAQQATHWQVGREGPDGCVFEPPVRDAWRQRQNWYDDEDLQADDDLGDEVFRDLEPATAYCWRARVRDSNLRWSAWSAPERFVTRAGGDQALGLLNGDAEQGTAHWRVEAGVFEAVRDGQCAGGDPYEGHQHFSVGGVCDSSELGVASQRVDVSAHGAALDAGERVLRFGGYLRTYNGRDRPDLWLRFFDGEGDLLGETAPVGTSAARWTLVADEAAPPLGTRAVELVLRGQRNAGSDNDSYFDGLFLRLGELAACDPLPARVIPPDGGMPDAGPEDSGFADAEASDAGPGDDGILDAAAER